EPEEEDEVPPPRKAKPRKSVPARMRPIKAPTGRPSGKPPRHEKQSGATSIDDIPMSDAPLDEDDSDRHKTRPAPRRIRQDESKYIEDENLFPGEAIEHRVEKRSSDPNNLRAKAEEM